MYAKVKQLGFTETHISRIANNGENPITLTNESLIANEAAILKLIEMWEIVFSCAICLINQS